LSLPKETYHILLSSITTIIFTTLEYISKQANRTEEKEKEQVKMIAMEELERLLCYCLLQTVLLVLHYSQRLEYL
jgi:hypothetical protein